MKKLLVSAAMIALGLNLQAQTVWNIDKGHSKIGFTVTHLMISDVEGNFKDITAKMTSTKDDFTDSQVDFTAKVASINTDDEKRDGHLKSDDFFNAEKYPDITFKSTSFKKVGDKKYKMTGNLTMRDKTKPVTFDVTYMGTVKDPWGNTKAGFKLTGNINRKDFGVSWSAAMDNGGVVVSDEVQIISSIEMAQQK